MAKDPAFLFYPGDWMGGTMIFTRHQKGCYIDLLIAQFNNGPLSLESIKAILGQDQAVWTILSSKFKQDSAGNYFNERLATEIEKRKTFSQKQSDRVSKRWNKDKVEKYHGTNSVSIGNIPIIENRNENENENFVLDPDLSKISELETDQAFEFVWRLGKKDFVRSDIADFWEAFKIHRPEYEKDLRAKQMQHFRDWLKFQKKQDGKTIKRLDTSKPGSVHIPC